MTTNVWRRHPNQVQHDEKFVAGILEMFDHNLDTAQMATLTLETEATCLKALWIGREQRRNETQEPKLGN